MTRRSSSWKYVEIPPGSGAKFETAMLEWLREQNLTVKKDYKWDIVIQPNIKRVIRFRDSNNAVLAKLSVAYL